MITITYEYDNVDLLVYKISEKQTNAGYSGILPRRNETVDIEGVAYRITEIKHNLNIDVNEIEQNIVLYLTKRLQQWDL